MNEIVDPYTNDEEPTLKMRNPLINHVEARGPNWGMIVGLLFCLGFWGFVLHLLGWF